MGAEKDVLSLADLKALRVSDELTEVALEGYGIVMMKEPTGLVLLELQAHDRGSLASFVPALLVSMMVNRAGDRLLASRDEAVELISSLPIRVANQLIDEALNLSTDVNVEDLAGKLPKGASSA